MQAVYVTQDMSNHATLLSPNQYWEVLVKCRKRDWSLALARAKQIPHSERQCLQIVLGTKRRPICAEDQRATDFHVEGCQKQSKANKTPQCLFQLLPSPWICSQAPHKHCDCFSLFFKFQALKSKPLFFSPQRSPPILFCILLFHHSTLNSEESPFQLAHTEKNR